MDRCSEKRFGCIKIDWLIENIRFQCANKDWCIQSPEFTVYGPEETKWCMVLRPVSSATNSKVSFILKRSARDSASKTVWVNLRLRFPVSVSHNDTEEREDDCEFPLSKGGKYEKSLKQFSKMNSMHSDLLTITCEMIVHNKITTRRFAECDDVGIKLLSEDLLNVYKHGNDYDILLRVGKKDILAHKALLIARSEVFRALIESEELDEDHDEYPILRLPCSFSHKELQKVLAFLYSGNLKHVLKEPSHKISDWALYLNAKAISDYYIPDELILRSSVDVELFNCLLNINYEEYEIEFSKHISECTYELIVCNKISTKIIPFHYESFEETSLKIAYLEIFVDRKKGLKLEVGENKCKISVKDLISSSKPQNDWLFMKLRISCMNQNSCVDNQRSIFKNCLDEDMCYKYLSKDLANLYLFDFGYGDAILISRTGVLFIVHRFILACRSDFFKNAFRVTEFEDIAMANMDAPVLGMVLEYLYSGSLAEDYANRDEKLSDVYKAAAEIHMPILKAICSEELKMCFKTNLSIRCRAIKTAEEYHDTALKNYFLNHLFASLTPIPSIPDLNTFRDVQACVHCV